MDDHTLERLEENDKALQLCKKQLDSLREDIEILIAFSGPGIVNMARQKAEAGQVMSNLANPSAGAIDTDFRDKCKRFVERYAKFSQG
jgi:hypothetical protein